MARYDIHRAWFVTPNGKSVVMHIREETNDLNTCIAALNEDEYGFQGMHFGGTAIDIGGHIGTVTIGWLVDNPELRVETVEPLPENIDLIRRSAFVNDVEDRLTIHEEAIGDGKPVTIRYAFVDNENDLHHAYIGNSVNPDFNVTGREHESITVRTLIPEDLPEASVMKIDCEGGEWPFLLQGKVSDFWRFPYIVGEWHPVGGHMSQDLEALLAYHDVTFTGPEEGPGGFKAVLRPDAGVDPSSAPATQLGKG